MTRINVVPPSELTVKHLIAEWREAPRVFGLVRKAIARGELPNDKRNPTQYTLGTGHVRFFYGRLGWLVQRIEALTAECMSRGYKISHTDTTGLTDGIPTQWLENWAPTDQALQINRARIAERLNKKVVDTI